MTDISVRLVLAMLAMLANLKHPSSGKHTMSELNLKQVAANPLAIRALRKDKIGRALMAIAAVLTMAAFIDGLRRMGLAGPDRIWVETLRTFGDVVFVGLFALLALRPRNLPALWELVMAYKLSTCLFGLWVGNAVPEIAVAVKMDLSLVALIAPAWVLCREWMTWSTWQTTDPIDDTFSRHTGVVS